MSWFIVKVGRKDGGPMPGEDEPLHAYVTASNPESVKKAVDKVWCCMFIMCCSVHHSFQSFLHNVFAFYLFIYFF